MKISRFLLPVLLILLLSNPTLAIPVKLSLESYSPATFPTVSAIIDLADMNDQLEVSRQAALFALSPGGWGWQDFGLGGWLQYREPPKWTGHNYFVDIPFSGQAPPEVSSMFGYKFNQEALTYGPHYEMRFHTDEWCSRLYHDIGETLDNYGVISGCMGGIWSQCPVPNWGRFWVEEVQPVPEPATIFLIASGLLGLRGISARLNMKNKD